jgi:hypothetical protein
MAAADSKLGSVEADVQGKVRGGALYAMLLAADTALSRGLRTSIVYALICLLPVCRVCKNGFRQILEHCRGE